MLLHNQYEFDPNTDLIGSGGFARVYKAFDINLHRIVALKRFDKKDTKYSVLNEIRRCFDFNHPNIIRYLNCFQVESTNNFGENDVVEFGVMEYADAVDFTQLIEKKVKVSTDEFKEIILGILDGLQYLHTPNAMHQKPAIIHRDLKASNILFTKIEGKLIPKICDFGISKEIGSLGATTATGTGYLGTIEYMAPEQINLAKYGKDGKLQPNTDLWALGCMLYEYFTGYAPFGKRADGDMQIDIQNKILDNEPKYPDTIPNLYKEIIQKCLVKNAANRVTDAISLKRIILDINEKAIEKNPVIKEDLDNIPLVIAKKNEILTFNDSVNNLNTIIDEKDKIIEDNDDEERRMASLIAITFLICVIIAIIYYAYNENTKQIEEATTDLVEILPMVVDTAAPIVETATPTELEFEYVNSAKEKLSYSGEYIYIGSDVNRDIMVPQGKGTAIYSNGDKYDGEFANGLREGNGIYYWKDGEKFVGIFSNNKRNGYGKYFDANGNLIEEGNYVDGELQ